jgi:hypothetical protein
MLFKPRKARLANGQTVREGDLVEFTNSDGEICRGRIERDVNNPKRLFFWNNTFEIADYKSAVRVDT